MPKKTPELVPIPSVIDFERDGGPREAAHYIKGAVEELAILARRHQLDMLGYLLDMAHQEADDAFRHAPHESP